MPKIYIIYKMVIMEYFHGFLKAYVICILELNI